MAITKTRIVVVLFARVLARNEVRRSFTVAFMIIVFLAKFWLTRSEKEFFCSFHDRRFPGQVSRNEVRRSFTVAFMIIVFLG